MSLSNLFPCCGRTSLCTRLNLSAEASGAVAETEHARASGGDASRLRELPRIEEPTASTIYGIQHVSECCYVQLFASFRTQAAAAAARGDGNGGKTFPF